VTKALAIQHDMEFIDLDKTSIHPTNLNLLPADLIRKHQVLPLGRDSHGKLKIVISDPTDFETLDALRFRLNVPLETCIGIKSKIKQQIQKLFANEQSSIDKLVRELSVDRGA